jgi:nucleotide-binding universal stress UspA family protein
LEEERRMKNILIPLEESNTLPAILEAAALLGRRFDSYLEGLHLRMDFSGAIAAAGMGGPYVIEDFRREDWDHIQWARRTFEDFARAKGLHLGGVAEGTGVSAHFRAEAPPGDTFLGQHTRLFDVTVLGRPSSSALPPRRSTLETVLFESGRPILMVPPITPATLGETVVIAWNASTETARTVSFARPILEQAGRVIVLSVEGGLVEGPSGDDLARYLKRAGIAAEARHVPQGRGIGETILEQSRALGADLLIKGAYTQSRLRQMIFGGVTSHVLAHADMPVLMAH